MEQNKTEESKKEFEKTIPLSIEKLKEIINDSFGIQVKLNDFPDNHHVIMKIIGEVQVVNVPAKKEEDDDKTFYKVPCKIKPKGYEDFEIMVQVGENAVKRLDDKFPDKSYIDKYAFFTKTKYGMTYPQFINPIEGELQEFKTKDDIFKKLNTEPVTIKPNVISDDMSVQERIVLTALLTDVKYLVWKNYAVENQFKFVEAYDKLATMLDKEKLDALRYEVMFEYFNKG